MSNGNQPDAGSSARELPETQLRGRESPSPESLEPIHESATIHRPIHGDAMVLGGPGNQAALADQSAADGDSGSITDPSEFRRAVLEIGLATEDELDGLIADVPASAGVLGLARALQKAGKLTAYQAAALYQRKSRGLLIGNYLILDKLGVGGMGVVFKARHRRLGRVAALKILPPSFARDRTALARFKREVEAAGRLKHPNIVAALDADEDRGVHFLVMQYVEGRDLDRVVRQRGPLRVVDAIEYLIQAVRGLAAAHAEGIVHRDIKPSNLMLDMAGTVRVLDLGLARLVDASNPFGQASGARLTESGMYMGTVDYMPPEQAEDSRRADHRADIYSLGCTLYYLLAGREPFPAETVLKRLLAHMELPGALAARLRPDVPRALEAVYQKMMAKKPDERPASMTEVIALLEACKVAPAEASKSHPELLVFDEPAVKRAPSPKPDREASIFSQRDEATGLPIDRELNLDDLVMDVRAETPVAPVPPRTKAGRKAVPQAKRLGSTRSGEPSRRPVVLAVLLIALACAAVAGMVRFSRRDRSQEQAALVAHSPSSAQAGSLENLSAGDGSRSRAENRRETEGPDRSRSGAQTRARSLTTEESANRLPDVGRKRPQPPPEFTSIFDSASGKGWILCDGRPLPRANVQPEGLNPHGTGSYLVAYEKPLGEFVLDFEYKVAKGGAAGVFLRVGDLGDPVDTGLEIALDDTPALGRDSPGAIRDLVAPRVNAQKPAGEWNHVRITAAGPSFAVSLNEEDVSTIDLNLWTVPGKRPDGSDLKRRDIAIAKLPREGYLGFQALYGDCWFKNIKVSSASLANGPAPVVPSYIETGRFTGGYDLRLLSSIDDMRRIPPADKWLAIVAASARGLTFRLWNSDRRQVAGVNAINLTEKRQIEDLRKQLETLWPPHELTSSEMDRLMAALNPIVGHTFGVTLMRQMARPPLDVLITNDGREAISLGDDGTAWLWEVETRKELRPFTFNGMVRSLAIAPDGDRIVTAMENLSLAYWDVATGKRIDHQVIARTLRVNAIAFCSNGLLVGDSDAVYFFRWDTTTRRPVSAMGRHHAEIQCLAITADGRLAISGGDDRLVRLWDIRAAKERALLTGHQSKITCVAISPDGQRALSASADKDVILWDLEKRAEITRSVLDGGELIRSAAFLADGRSVLSGGDKGTLVLWDLESGVAVRQGQGPAGHSGLAARPDGSLVLTADSDGIVRIWSPSRLRLPGAPTANLLVNGSFELGPDVQDVPQGPGSTAIPGWTVTREPIDCVSNALRAADGKRCLDIHGSPGCGGIRQSFLTTKGQRYRVTFAMAGSIPGGSTGNREIKRLGVSAAGMKGEFSFDTTGKSPDNMGWTTKTWEFVAVDGETSLEFYSVDRKDPLFGPALDDVRVVAQPGNNSSL